MIFPPAVTGGVAAHTVQKSLRFRPQGADGSHLSRTPSVAGNRKTLAQRFRIKRAALGSLQVISSAGTSSVDRFYFDSSDRLCLDVLGTTRLVTTAVFRDPTAWHVDVGFELDVGNGTAASRAKILIDGVEVSSYSTDTRSSITNTDTNWNNTVAQYIGRDISGNYFNGYIAEPTWVDGSTSVAAYSYNGPNGVRDPLKPAAVYGTTGSYVPFTNGTSLVTLGYDQSGRGNNWDLNFFSITAGADYDWMDDTPSNNYFVLNALEGANDYPNRSVTQQNLRVSKTANTFFITPVAPLPSSGKWYFEITMTLANDTSVVGLFEPTSTSSPVDVIRSASFGNGIRVGGSVVASFTPANGDVFGFKCDVDAGTVEVLRNGVSVYTATSLSIAGRRPGAFAGGATTSVTTTFNFGQHPFGTSLPSGYQTLCSANLTSTTITTSGSFTGNANADGPFVWLNGIPTTMTINGNAVTFGTHADKLANGFKVRSNSASYNASGSNTYSITLTGAAFKNARAQVNP